MLDDQPPVIYGDGEQSRDFTYVDNVVEANLLAMTVHCEYGLPITCACRRRVTLNQLIAQINRITGKDIEPVFVEPRQGEIRHSLADIQRAEA